MRRGNPGRYAILRMVLIICIIAYIAAVFIMTGGSTKSFDEVRDAVVAGIDMEHMQDAGAHGLKRYYGLNAAEFEGAALYTSEYSMVAEELLIIKVADASQVQEVEEAIDRRIESRINDFEGYAPEQAAMLENARRSTRGNFIFLSVSPDADAIRDTFLDSL